MTGKDSDIVMASCAPRRGGPYGKKEEDAIQTEDKTGKSESGKSQSEVQGHGISDVVFG